MPTLTNQYYSRPKLELIIEAITYYKNKGVTIKEICNYLKETHPSENVCKPNYCKTLIKANLKNKHPNIAISNNLYYLVIWVVRDVI
jgi:DNA-binding transcriptional MerR regulator